MFNCILFLARSPTSQISLKSFQYYDFFPLPHKKTIPQNIFTRKRYTFLKVILKQIPVKNLKIPKIISTLEIILGTEVRYGNL